MKHLDTSKIAIIGLGFRFPGNLSSLDQYFTALENKECLVTQVSSDRFNQQLFTSKGKDRVGHSKTFAAGVLDHIFDFDNKAIKFSKKEIEAMDPQQRLCLEMMFDALASANLSSQDVKGTQTGVFIGAASTDMAMAKADDLAAITSYGMTGTNLSIISNRLSYYFDLHGPSMTIDTACSSSMVALDQAVQYVSKNPQHMCIAGGVNILLSPMPFVGFSQAHMLSPDGRCKVFDDSANGYVRSEGGAVLILKNLDQAIADGDHIYATIVKSKVNQDGRTLGISLPSEQAQQQLLTEIYESCDISRLVYLEAHGTGTLVGDPIEVTSIGKSLGQKVKQQFNRDLLIGSVKSNLGHLETASGMAGLVKAIAILQKHKIPASINIEKLNHKIDFDSLGLKVVQDEVDFPQVKGPCLIGVNSFGFGGTNAHVILEEYIPSAQHEVENQVSVSGEDTVRRSHQNVQAKKDATQNNDLGDKYTNSHSNWIARGTSQLAVPDLCNLLVDQSFCDLRGSFFKIAAATEHSLVELAKSYKAMLTVDNYQAVIATNFYCQSDYELNLYLHAKTFDELSLALDEFILNPTKSFGVHFEKVNSLKLKNKSIFVFSGNGAQYPGMGYSLYTSSPLFKAIIDRIDQSLQHYQSWSVAQYLAKDNEEWDLSSTEIVQPIVFALEVALVEYLRCYGIEADAACGHSVGEVAASYYCGALSLEDACKVIVYRSKNQALTFNQGDMAVIKLERSKLDSLLANEQFNQVEIAAINTSNSFTLSGDKEQLTKLVAYAKETLGVGAKFLNLNYPFHSSKMELIKEQLNKDLACIEHQPLVKDFYSCVDGYIKKGQQLQDKYWWFNIRHEVKFYEAISLACADQYNIFIEIGPREILLNYVKDIAKQQQLDLATLSLITKQNIERFHLSVAKFLSSSLFVNPQYIFDPSKINRQLQLPLYPFDKHPFNPPISSEKLKIFNYEYNELLGKNLPYSDTGFINEIDLERNDYLGGHIVLDKVLYPAAALINMAIAALRKTDRKDQEILALDNFTIMRATELKNDEITVFKTQVNGYDFRIDSRIFSDTPDFNAVVKAVVCRASSLPTIPCLQGYKVSEQSKALASLQEQASAIDPNEFYQRALSLGIDYQGKFRSVTSIAQQGKNIYLTLDNTSLLDDQNGVSIFALDGALQSLFALLPSLEQEQDVNLMLPSTIEHLFVYNRPYKADKLQACISLRNISQYDALLDMVIYAEQQPVIYLQGVRYLKYSARKDIITGRFIQNLKPVDSLIADKELSLGSIFTKLCKEDGVVASSLKQLVDEFEQNKPAELDNYLKILVCGYICKHIALYDQSATIPELFGDQLDLSFNEDLAVYMLDFLVANGVAQKTDEFTYKVSSDFKNIEIDKLFSTIVYSSPSAFAQAELICRLGDNLMALLNESKDVKQILGVGRDNVFTNYRRYNSISNTLSSKIRFILDLLLQKQEQTISGSQQHLYSIAELYSGNLNLISSLDSILKEQTFNYTLIVSSNAEFTSLENKFTAYSNIKVCKLSEVKEQFDILISQDAFANTEFNKQVGQISNLVKSQGIILGFELANNLIDNWIFNLASSSSELSIVSNLVDGTIFNSPENKLLLNQSVGNYIFYCYVLERDTQVNVTVEAEQKLDLGLVVTLDNKLSEVAKYLSQVTTCQTIEFNALFSLIKDIEQERGLKHTLPYHQITFDFSSLSLDYEQVELVASFMEQLSVILTKLSLLKDIQVTVLLDKIELQANALEQDLLKEKVLSYALLCYLRTVRNELSIKLQSICLQDQTELTLKHLLACYQKQATNDFGYNEVAISGLSLKIFNFALQEAKESSKLKQDQVLSTLQFKHQGNLNSLYFRDEPLPELQDDEILVRNACVALNYRDVMWALGLLPAEALEHGFSGQSLGLECSGVVAKVGKNIKDLELGTRVLAFAKNCFANYVIVKRSAVHKIPDSLSLAEAATIPVTFITAYYSIVTKAQAQEGERILIHGGAGGVGLAAIQIAQDLGLEIYATAGTEQKRALLKRLGVQHVYDSRSLDFANQIMLDTKGEGIDIVLNSLYKDGAIASLKLLRPFGRFIELGKRDFFENNSLHLKIFKDNLSFFGVDVDELLVYRNDFALKLFNEILNKFVDESYFALPFTLYNKDQVKQAFADMKASQHIGKLIVSLDDCCLNHAAIDLKYSDNFASNQLEPTSVESIDKVQNNLGIDSPEQIKGGTFIITGGLGGVGYTIAQYLIANQASKIYLLGRSSYNEVIDSKVKALNSYLKQKGQLDSVIEGSSSQCQVEYLSIDISNAQNVSAFVSQLAKNREQVTGFYHTAVVLDDKFLNNMQAQDYLISLKAKVLGLCNFMHAFQQEHLPPLYTVLLSSITTMFGNEGQANYVLANGMLEALTYRYQEHGFKVITFLLGPVKGVGLLKDQAKLVKLFENKLGLIALDAKYLVKVIHQNLNTQHPLCICDFNGEGISQVKALQDSRFNCFKANYNIVAQQADKSLLEKILSVSEAEAVELLSVKIQEIFAQQLGLDSSQISTTSNLLDLGIDSLSLMETVSILEKELDIETNIAQLSGNNSISSIASYCVAKLKRHDEKEDDVFSVLEKQHGSSLKDDIKNASTRALNQGE